MKKYGQVYKISFDGGIYVGSAIGNSFGRWAAHVRLLRTKKHHCKRLQEAFNLGGITSFSFSVVESKIDYSEILKSEFDWSEKLCGINARPSKILKHSIKLRIAEDILAGIPYREISKRHGASLGAISSIKRHFLD